MVRRRGALRGRARWPGPRGGGALGGAAADIEARGSPPAALGDQAAVAPREARGTGRSRQGGERATAPASAGAEVADVDLHRGGAGVLERQGPGNVAGHTVVAEGGEQDHTGPLRAGSEVIED